MSRQRAAPGAAVSRLWRRLSPFPGGPWLFSRILGRMVPYSGTIRPRIERLEPGDVRLSFRDRRGVRNHLASVHAVALANAGELAGGLALLTALPAGTRGIVTRLSVEYLRKARGRLVAESRTDPPEPGPGAADRDVTAEVSDASGAVVARITTTWRLETR